MPLRLSTSLSLPEDFVTETIGIVGVKGSGKTYTAKVLTELMAKALIPVCVLDPLGVWYGLRTSADGKSAGLPFVILGGEHGDAPLESTAGEVIADFVIDEAGWTVLDLSLFRKAEMRRFVTAFLVRLYHRNRHPLHLMLDEADLFAPQRPGKDETTLLGAMEDLIRRGRAKGLGATLITQRPAVLHKDVLTQVSTLVAHRLTGPQDRNALDAWVQGNGTREQRDEMMATLASLPTGTAWFWSPHWLDTFAKVKVSKATTFDSSATPGRGSKALQPRARAEVDIEALTERIAATIERAKENDPAALRQALSRARARIATLEAQADARQAEPEVVVQEVPVLPPMVEDLASRLAGLGDDLAKISRSLVDHGVELGREVTRVAEYTPVRGTTPAPRRSAPRPASQRPAAQRPAPAAPANDGDLRLGKAHRSILAALAPYHPTPRTLTQVALLAGYTKSGGGFRNAVSALRTAGLIEGSDPIGVTSAGLEALGDYDPLPTGAALVDFWLRQPQLGKAHRAILEALTKDYPDGLDRATLAERTGYEESGGGFRNAISRLRTLELIHGRDILYASDEFF